MLEVFKIVVLCLICTIIAAIFSTVLLTAVLLLILVIIFYDFNFETPFERHAINKVKHAYFKVRNVFHQVYQSQIVNYSNHYIYSPIMNNVNKQPSDFDLSKFNRSGSVFSPISRIGASASSRRLPTQTSTPLTRNSPWQKNSSTPTKTMTFQSSTISRSPRYSLSSNDNSNEANKNNNQSPTVQTVAGPLLASTRFNINLGMYTDTISPGLVNRIVQYNNESQSNEAQTHQSKYKSPGQFPIVQLYKKKLPLLTRTPKRCTVRVAPPDCVTYNSPEGNMILKETFVQRNTENNNNNNQQTQNQQQTQSETEMYTKSVLDALKEISRKRIHSNDDLDDLSKRQRKGSVSNIDNTNKDGKRLREDTPPKPKGQPTSPSTNNMSKKICVTNEIECSLSSSILMRLQGQKRKAGILGDSLITNTIKQRRISQTEMKEKNGNHISRTTQTLSPTSDDSNNTNKSISHSTQTNFSETSLDKNSKNLTDTPKKSSSQSKTENTEYTGLQQILQNAKRKKKQYFEKSIDEIDDERSSVQFSQNSQGYTPLFSHEPMEIIMKNRLEVAMAALNGDKPEIIPLPKLTLTEMLEKKKLEAQNENALKESKALTSILSPKNKSKHDKHVSFDIPDSEKSQNPDQVDSKTPEKSSDTNKPETDVQTPDKPPSDKPLGPQISFGPITSTTLSNNTISTPQVKVNLQVSPQFKFGETRNQDTTPKGPSLGQNVDKKEPSLSFGQNVGSPSANLGSGTLNFGSKTSTPKSLGSAQTSLGTGQNLSLATPNFGSGASNLSSGALGTVSGSPVQTNLGDNTPKSAPINFGANVQPVASTTVISFGSTTALPSPVGFGGFGAVPKPNLDLAPISKNETSQPNFSFGAKPASTSASGVPAFGVTSSSTSNAVVPSFGSQTPTQGANFSFGKTESPAFSFGAKSPPKTGGFKFDLGKGAPVSTNTEAPKVDGGKPTFSFGASNAPSTFGGNSSNVPSFGTGSTGLPGFGANTASTTAPSFGVTTTTQSLSVFGTNSEPKSLTFDSNTSNPAPGFGSSTIGSVFGGSSTTSAPVFDSTTQTTSAPIFGSITTTSTPAFGVTTTASAPIFGSNSTTTSSVFGNTSFGGVKPENTGFNFGSTTQQSTTFGSNNFTAPTTQSSGFNFGAAPNAVSTSVPTTSTNTFNFGSNASQGTKPFSFNSTTSSNVFSGTNTPSFGTAQNSGVFGAPSTTSQSTNVFGAAPSTTQSVFGATTTTTTATGFGGTNSGVFGSSATNFSANNNNGGVFSNQNNASFGGSATKVNNFPAPSFGAATANTAGVFGGNTGTTSNVFGSPNTAKPAFGTATSPPSFGSTFGNTAPPSFGATTQASSVFGTNSAPTNTNFGASNNNNAQNNNNNNNGTQNSGSFGSFGAPNQSGTTPCGGLFTFGNQAAAAPAASAFTFGAASPPSKPSGFNFSGSATPNLNFSGGNQAPPPAFGAQQGPPPAFGGQPSTMFSIGSGSTGPKQRTIIKARRRNN